MNLSPLENAVLALLFAGDDPCLVALRQQPASARVATRTKTGVGFFVDFALPEGPATCLRGRNLAFGDVVGASPELKNGLGFVVFVRNGKLSMLEGYTFDEPWPQDEGGVSVAYERGTRDRKKLLRELHAPEARQQAEAKDGA